MSRLALIFLAVLISGVANSQSSKTNPFAAVDAKTLQMPESLAKSTDSIAAYFNSAFSKEHEKVRGIFVWVASMIEYDVANMYAIDFYEKEEEKIRKALETRKGICEDYAALFKEIALKCGIRTVVIHGYTKQNGFTDYIPHAWCASQIDTVWYLFDPTWGSGYLSNGKFVRKISNSYFKPSPSTFIKSHMPFDYLWQMLNFPLTSQEFYEGRIAANETKTFFNYRDSIDEYEKLPHSEQLIASARRIEGNGVKNSLIYDRLHHIKREIEHERQTRMVDLYNAAVVDYNDGVALFNEFIHYRNKQFSPMKSDAAIQKMLDDVVEKITAARSRLSQLKNPDANILSMTNQLRNSLNDLENHQQEQQAWLGRYFSKSKSGRKSMFYETKVTWFGIPLTK